MPPEWEAEDEDSEPGTIAAVPTVGMAPLASLVVRSTDGHIAGCLPTDRARGARSVVVVRSGNDILLTA